MFLNDFKQSLPMGSEFSMKNVKGTFFRFNLNVKVLEHKTDTKIFLIVMFSKVLCFYSEANKFGQASTIMVLQF